MLSDRPSNLREFLPSRSFPSIKFLPSPSHPVTPSPRHPVTQSPRLQVSKSPSLQVSKSPRLPHFNTWKVWLSPIPYTGKSAFQI